jgi:hypothetical protein
MHVRWIYESEAMEEMLAMFRPWSLADGSVMGFAGARGHVRFVKNFHHAG